MMPDPTTQHTTSPTNGDAATPVVPVPILPYSRPDGYEEGVWRSGQDVAVTHGMDLPDRCVQCNRPAVRRMTWRMWRLPGSRNPNWRVAPLHIGLCRRHLIALRIWRIVFGLLFAGLAVVFSWDAALLANIVADFRGPNVMHSMGTVGGIDPFVVLAAALGGAGAMASAYCFTRLRLWRISRRTRGATWIRFTGQAFRDSLPLIGTNVQPQEELPHHGWDIRQS